MAVADANYKNAFICNLLIDHQMHACWMNAYRRLDFYAQWRSLRMGGKKLKGILELQVITFCLRDAKLVSPSDKNID